MTAATGLEEEITGSFSEDPDAPQSAVVSKEISQTVGSILAGKDFYPFSKELGPEPSPAIGLCHTQPIRPFNHAPVLMGLRPLSLQNQAQATKGFKKTSSSARGIRLSKTTAPIKTFLFRKGCVYR